MNSIVKAATRFSSMKNALSPLRQVLFTSQSTSMVNAGSSRLLTRTLWHMCSTNNSEILKLKNPSYMCSCGCSSQLKVHTKAEKDLVDFLTEEISTEKKTQKKQGNIPAELDGFKIESDGSEVTLTKKSGNETVNVFFNVNHTVDADASEAAMDPNQDQPDLGDMKSEPTFEVELVRGSQTLGFTCSFISAESQNPEDEYQDVFSIDEVTMYEGEWKEKTYAVSGEILDGNLYDLLMNLLEEKGVSNEFVDKLSSLSTKYEHNLYVNMLEKLQKFANSK